MTTFTVETIAAQPAAAIRAEVPMAELPGVFDRAFPEVMRAVGVQGVARGHGRRAGGVPGGGPDQRRR